MKASSSMAFTDLRAIPPRPNLEYYKKRAKTLVKDFRAAEPSAVETVATFLGSGARRLTLTGAQAIVAREHGFVSWPRFAAHVQALQNAGSRAYAFEAAADAIAQGDEAILQD